MFERVCEVIDRPDLIDDERYRTMDDRIEHRPELREELQEAFASFAARELETLLLESRVPAAAVRTMDEVVEMQHLEVRSLLTESYNPEVDESVDVASLPFTFGSEGERPGYSSPPPKKGEHTEEVLEQFEYSSDQIESLRRNGAID